MTDKDLDKIYQIAEQAVIDYNTQAVPGWIMRDYIVRSLLAYGDARAAEMRDRAQQMASDWGSSEDDPGISALEFDRRYGRFDTLAAAIAALPLPPRPDDQHNQREQHGDE